MILPKSKKFFVFFSPNWLVTATNQFLLVIFGPVRLFWVWERRLTSLGLSYSPWAPNNQTQLDFQTLIITIGDSCYVSDLKKLVGCLGWEAHCN